MKRKTAGELALKAQSDSTPYNALEVGYALTEDIKEQLELCIKEHNKIFDEDEYCVVMVVAGDPMIKGVMRRKFYGWPYLPSPRPNQTVFLYSKKKNMITKRLWVLPHVLAMETLYETQTVIPRYQTMKEWSMAFYDGCFWEFIRKQHGIDMLSESEYLHLHREKLVKSGSKQVNPLPPKSFDFSKIGVNKIIDSHTASIDKGALNDRGKT